MFKPFLNLIHKIKTTTHNSYCRYVLKYCEKIMLFRYLNNLILSVFQYKTPRLIG